THASRLAYFAPIINRCAGKYRVPVALICGVMLQESGGNPKAVSPCGARGLMQLMPGTAKRMGVTNIMDPHQNIEGGVRYLRFLLDRFRGNTRLAVAAYNCGEGNVEKYGNRIPPFAETQAYVPNVLAYAETIHRLLGSAGRKV
ncbi:MAG: lytic transglycosylase domain-containing protein, partial [Deltaproteobacteria bacterium]|nr:lytic transglycosylase domain-containing protein [Deltaproteobacteria bacterium]